MKVHLLFRDRNFDFKPQSLATHPYAKVEAQKVLPQEESLIQDLELNTLFNTMANSDKFVFEVIRQVLFCGLQNDVETVLYRQSILQDTLKNNSVVREIYDLAVEAIEHERRRWWGVFSKSYPSGTLHSAVELVQVFMGKLDQLRQLGASQAAKFDSAGFGAFFSMLRTELADEYFAAVSGHLKQLKFNHGVLLSARLGDGNQGTEYVLRQFTENRPWWVRRILPRKADGCSFSIDPRDEAGARALGELQDRGINLVANALAQSADHILSFFAMLRIELAFYLGCATLYRRLEANKTSVCFPVPTPPGTHTHSSTELRDVCLVLTMNRPVVGNDLEADTKKLCVITGANQGGKSTFLRAIGLAQLMMQCGMFVAARSFSADLCRGLFTHYKREEDTSMASGKFDEELARMSRIVDLLAPHSLLLFNESFAATNEREGSEIASQIVHALLEKQVRIFFVTHFYDFAHRFEPNQSNGVLFLRAERRADGQRTFKLLPGRPLETSYGADIYRKLCPETADGACTQGGIMKPAKPLPSEAVVSPEVESP